MSKVHKQGDADAPSSSPAAFVVTTIADTTWRMFIPTIGALLLGTYGDKHFGTFPWLFIASIIIGVAISAVLIRRQLKQV